MPHGTCFEKTARSEHASLLRETLPALDLRLSPSDVAQQLAHLPGLIWLDSAQADAGAVTLITAAPSYLLTGHIDRDWPLVEAELNRHTLPDSADSPFVTAGLFGWVGFDGQFILGHYPHALIYQHDSGTWSEIGSLAAELRPKTPPNQPPPSLRFCPEVSRSEFMAMVARARDYIAAGDIYQVNLSQPWRSHCAPEANLLATYHRLRQGSPAPHAAFACLADTQVLSTSPELFLKIAGRSITTRPIKGTRPRFPADPVADAFARADLLASEKERAELLMITDLERNDLGQVCEFGSIQVTDLWQVESYPQVFHLVSTVTGTLRAGVSHAAAFAACFPGGSITGAPKKRALEIIHELEPHPRGLYTGAIGGFGFNGHSQWNIAIRTAIHEGDQLHFHTGAGIVADSDPALEYEETLHKAAGLLLLGDV